MMTSANVNALGRVADWLRVMHGKRNAFAALILIATLFPHAMTLRAAEDAGAISLDEAREQLGAIQREMAAAKDERRLLEFRKRALTLQSELREASDRLAPELAQIDARMAELGAQPERADESTDVATERRQLEQSRATIEGQLRLANLLSLEADQTAREISARSRSMFREQLGVRARSPLQRSFWVELGADMPRDARHARAVGRQIQEALRDSSVPGVIAALLVGAFTLFGRRRVATELLQLPVRGRLRRSLRVSTDVVLWTASAGIIAAAIIFALSSGEAPASYLAAFLQGVGAIITFGVYVLTLGAGLLSFRAPSWRLPRISDEVASALHSFPAQFAAVVVFVSLIELFTATLNLSLSLSVALNGLTTLVLGVVLARGLRRALEARRRAVSPTGESPEGSAALPLWIPIAAGFGWVVFVGSILCVLLGYVSLASFIVRQSAWTLIVLCTAYLVVILLEDILVALLSTKRTKGSDTADPRQRTRATVLLSALARVTIGLGALFLVLAPYGAGIVDLFPGFHRVQEGVSIGAIELRPGPVARGILVLVLGIAAVRLVKQWTQKRYLPTTRMDAGMRESVTSLIGYVGYGIVISMTLSAMGVGLQKIAWVASALALGIGFGLQAIVQNFVSGLILLAERPVKVGDWVALEQFEGDIRRINARATEIQRIDRSTIIVPNSEFITKVVRNVTYANPLGLVQIRLPVPLGADVERVRMELLQAFRAHADVLRTPEPVVMLDGVEGGSILFNARGYVSSPRAVARVRSALLFEILMRFKETNPLVSRPVTVALTERSTLSTERHDDGGALTGRMC
jgi:potassium-dependent mechanosensitive channel